MSSLLTAFGLFFVTAVAEIFGCYAFHLVFVAKRNPAWLAAGVASLMMFAWLLTLHPTVAGRTYAIYGGVYIAASLCWLKWVDGQSPDLWDLVGAAVCLCGAGIMLASHLRDAPGA